MSNHKHGAAHPDYDSRAAISKLTEAETRAQQVISAAKNRKNVLMKTARDQAATETKKLTAQFEKMYENTNKAVQTSEQELMNRIKDDKDGAIRNMERQFKENFRATLVFVLNEILQSSLPEIHQNQMNY